MAEWMKDVAGVVPAEPPDAALGFACLAELAALSDATETITRIGGLLADPFALDCLAAAWREHPHRVQGELVKLGARRGLRPRLAPLERAIRERAAAQERAERTSRGSGGRSEDGELLATTLAPILGSHELPAGLRCPSGWEVTPEGIARMRVHPETGEASPMEVCSRPVLIEGRYRDVGDNTVTFALSWLGADGAWHHHAVPRGKAADARSLVVYAAHDAPVTSNTAADLVRFLEHFEAANRTVIPEAKVAGQMGWHTSDGARCFLWGRTVVRASGLSAGASVEHTPPARWATGELHLLVSEPGVRALADGFTARGTWEGWCELLRAATPFPRAMLAVYAALVPPLMPFLPTLANFIVDFCGETSRGKTTTLRLAASVWGNPDERGGGIVRSWDATRVYIERAAALTTYLPTFLDDTKRARRPEDVGHVLYDFASGVGRGRGSLQSVQGATRAHGVLLSTGEAPATSFTNDGGTRARTLCLWGSPFGGCTEATQDAVQRLSGGVLEHHGHAGPRLVEYLAGLADDGEGLRRLHAWRLEEWTKRANGNPVAGRAAHYVAALDVAKWLLHEALGAPVPEIDPVPFAWEAVVQGSAESDRASDALRDVLSWATSQQHRFYGRLDGDAGGDTPPQGWLGAWANRADWRTLAVLPTELRGFLERQKYDVEAVLRTWEERGWLLRDEGHRTRKVTIGGRKERCVVVTRTACAGVQYEAAPSEG